jgi:hypothetical protein
VKIIVFVGPTLSVSEAMQTLDADYRPPVAQGDVYRATAEEPWGIGIIDGYFERLPAVWHKEILWALHHGVHVFGASSMGALRAAELAPFGMVGVGEVFRAFNDGTLTDDDEVTVLHGEPEQYRELSVAMVDIRATLAAAERAGILSRATSTALANAAKELNYTERTFDATLALAEFRSRAEPRASTSGVSALELKTFRRWLREGRVFRKRLDALALLQEMGRQRLAHPGSHEANFAFEHTDAWEQVRRQHRTEAATSSRKASLDKHVLDELRLQPQLLQRVMAAAFARVVALEEAERRGLEVDVPMFRNTVEAFRRELELLDTPSVEHWFSQQHLDRAAFAALMQGEAKLRSIRRLYDGEVMAQLEDELRLTGLYGGLVARAQDKQRYLHASGNGGARLEDTGLNEEALFRWYFEACLRRAAPTNLDIAVVNAGFADRDLMLRVLLAEYLYRRDVLGAQV